MKDVMIYDLSGFFFQAEDGIRDAQESRGLGDVYKRQGPVDAAIVAITKTIEDLANIEFEEYHVDAITGGTLSLIHI